MNLTAYLQRISFKGSPSVSLDCLNTIHRQHVLSVPFENLDVYHGHGISLDPEAVFDKLVSRRRGGYCFEMNSLLQHALTDIGFQVRPLLARVVMGGADPDTRPQTHQLLLVELDEGPYLCDVGFGGGGLIEAFPFKVNEPQQQANERLRLVQHPKHSYILQCQALQGWQALYTFNLEHRFPIDFELANFYTSQWPASIFRKIRICAITTQTGRLSLRDKALTEKYGQETRSRLVKDDAEFQSLLKERFGITLNQS